jgi:hypothetical protein
MAYAVNIPLGDPSFEDYTVPAVDGFAYAQPIYTYVGAYRPPTTGNPSAWVDDLDSPAGSVQDDGNSNWIYNAAYGESSAAHRRAAPRTGVQAMHTLGNYNAQETSAVFQANTTYTFSMWAQGDIDATVAAGSAGTSRIFLYIFDGTVPFSEANSLIFKRYAPDTGDFVNRGPTMTPAQSAANWQKISLSYTVLPGSSVIGHTVGVAFWGGPDGAVEDATLEANPVPEPGTMVLVGLGGLSLVGLRRRRE